MYYYNEKITTKSALMDLYRWETHSPLNDITFDCCIYQPSLYSAYFLSISCGDIINSNNYLLSYNLVKELLEERIIEPELSEEEFKVQFALGTVELRKYKLDIVKLKNSIKKDLLDKGK